MIIREKVGDTMIRTYSDAGLYIYGGSPPGNYVEALDPIDKPRYYIETDLPIEEINDPNKETEEERFAAFLQKRKEIEEELNNRNNPYH